MFDFLLGRDQEKNQRQIDQLFQLHATFRFATVELLDGKIESEQGLGHQIQSRSMELYHLINKTRLIDEFDYWGYDGKEPSSRTKINEPTDNTHEACFALINNDKEKFDKLIQEGPSKEALDGHNKRKASLQAQREKFLEKVRSCQSHIFSTGFMEYQTCRNCGAKKDGSNVE